MVSLCAFDLDGTLVDTLRDIAAAVNFALRSLGQPEHSQDAIRRMVGNGMRHLCAEALPPGSAVAPETLEAAYGARYLEHCCELSRPYDGLHDLLAGLERAGIRLAVVTNKPQAQAERVLAHYFPRQRFDCIIGQGERFARKPAPDALLWLLERCGVQAENALYAGDSDVDVKFAHAAGVRCAGMAWGFRGRAHLEQAGADYVCDTAQELRACILA